MKSRSESTAFFEAGTMAACARFDQPLEHSSATLEVKTVSEVVHWELKFPQAMPSSVCEFMA
jgi:hypothetical protein